MRLAWLGMAGLLICSCGGPPAGPPQAGGKSVQHWLDGLRDKDAKVRKEAVLKLGNLGADDPAARPAVIGALQDPDPGVRCQAILGLARAGDDPAVIPALEAVAKDKDPKVREFATRALKQLRDNG